MKKLFVILGLVIGLSTFAQPKYVGRFFGDGAGVTNIPLTGLKNYGNIVTNQVPLTVGLPVVGDGGSGVVPTNNLTVATATAQQFLISGVSNKVAVFQSNGVMVGTNTIHISGQFIADTAPGFIGNGGGGGSGLTNLFANAYLVSFHGTNPIVNGSLITNFQSSYLNGFTADKNLGYLTNTYAGSFMVTFTASEYSTAGDQMYGVYTNGVLVPLGYVAGIVSQFRGVGGNIPTGPLAAGTAIRMRNFFSPGSLVVTNYCFSIQQLQ